SSVAPVEGAGLPLEQMRLTIEDGLVMIFGPENDPVPPYAFAAAAAARPDARVGLPDGTTAAASRVATVLGAQILGQLGGAQQGAAWILAMLRDGGRPEDASEDALSAEQAVQGAAAAATVATDAGDFATGREPEGGDQTASLEHERTPAAGADVTLPTPQDEDSEYHEALDQTSLDQAAARIELTPDAALPPLALDLEELASTDASLDLDFSDDRFAADRLDREPDDMPALRGSADLPHAAAPPEADEPVAGDPEPERADFCADDGRAPEQSPGRAPLPSGPAAVEAADVERVDLDPESMALVVIRGVPEGARLSTGMRDEDGSWSISPLDLSTVTISLAAQGSGHGAAGASAEVDGDLNITGIALTEDGELVAISETVPLADYLADPASGDAAPMQGGGTRPANDPASALAPRALALEVDTRAWAGERFDALVIRDLPAGARLSVGAYDPAIAGWVLRPQDLSALAILPPPALRGDFTLTLMVITLRPGDANAARILARLPVTV
ncbi:MAG: hypothetical protein ACREJ0_21230, partial [Geminicoccaceae bacterium]